MSYYPVDLVKREEFQRLGKFQSARDQLLWEISLDGMLESSGNSEAPTGWFCAISIDADELREWILTSESLREAVNDMVSAREPFGDLIGHFMLTTYSSGAVWSESFDSAEALDEAYAKLETQYNEWDDEEFWWT